MRRSNWLYLVLAAVIVIIDRITKSMALKCANQMCKINDHLSFNLVFNRGVSWGMFHAQDGRIFFAVSLVITCLIAALLIYTIIRRMNRYAIVGEVMILAGALSNLADRIIYKGVIDFIVVTINGYAWPVFNIADAAIVVGAGILLFSGLRES